MKELAPSTAVHEEGHLTTSIDSEAIWNEFHTRLLSYVRRRVATEDDALDLLQDVFTRIETSAAQGNRIESVSGWVFQITRNAITDYYRSQAKAADTVRELADQHSSEDEDDNAKAELASCLRPLVDQLPDDYKQAVALTDLGGLSQVRAAEQVGLSVSGMKSRVQRGRAKLRDLLLECCHVELDGRKGVVGFEPHGGSSDDGCSCC